MAVAGRAGAAVVAPGTVGPGTALGRSTVHQGDEALSLRPYWSPGPWSAVLAGMARSGLL